MLANGLLMPDCRGDVSALRASARADDTTHAGAAREKRNQNHPQARRPPRSRDRFDR
ncbi:hypothetical protein BDI4_10040 [Burkholderia diffusa]|nr:hypothetical protein BDI4_10040 [Burkholderia diffusa]